MACNAGTGRRVAVAGFVATWIMTAISIGHAQPAASPWLMAADPFEKFFHDILDFTKWYVDYRKTRHDEVVTNAAPALVKSMHNVAAKKRQLASDIEATLAGSPSSHYVNVDRQAVQLDRAVRELSTDVTDLAPMWVVQHNDLSKDVDRMEVQKAAVSQHGIQMFVGGKGAQLDKDEAQSFANRLKVLADKLDGLADQIAQAINT